ncbi:MAG: DUF6468 domain-containing protein [Oceanicaulis sp.]
MTFASLAFEGLVCVLLLAAAVMCWRVDRRLRALRDGQDGLKDTIGALNDAVDRARASLAALDRASREQGASLKSEVEHARTLCDELRYLNDQGEAKFERAETRTRRDRPTPRQPTAEPQSGGETPARSRLNALKALR